MKKNFKKQIINISLVVMLALIAFLLVKSSTEELNFNSLGEFFDSCNLWYILAAIGCMILFVVAEALSIHVILKKFGHKPKFFESLAYSTSDVYYSGITPSATGGQPASAFYMIRDGVPGGTACFGLIFNLIGYTAALVLIGSVVFVFNIPLFLSFSLPVQILVGGGLLVQVFLFIFFFACMRKAGIIMSVGKFFINLLCKVRILKKREKWYDKLENTVEKYRSCEECFESQKTLFIPVLIWNVIQRAALIGVSVFVCASASDCSIPLMFTMQTFVMLGYNSIPLPGGTGAFEYLYMNIYDSAFGAEFIVIAMMVTRTISYYLSMVLCGIYTFIYHIAHPSEKKAKSGETITDASETSI